MISPVLGVEERWPSWERLCLQYFWLQLEMEMSEDPGGSMCLGIFESKSAD